MKSKYQICLNPKVNNINWSLLEDAGEPIHYSENG